MERGGEGSLAEPALLETEEDTPAIEHKDEGEQLVRLHGGVVGVVGPGRGRAIQGTLRSIGSVNALLMNTCPEFIL